MSQGYFSCNLQWDHFPLLTRLDHDYKIQGNTICVGELERLLQDALSRFWIVDNYAWVGCPFVCVTTF